MSQLRYARAKACANPCSVISRTPAAGARGAGVDAARGASVALTPTAASSSSATAAIVPGACPKRRVTRAGRTVRATRHRDDAPSPGACPTRRDRPAARRPAARTRRLADRARVPPDPAAVGHPSVAGARGLGHFRPLQARHRRAVRPQLGWRDGGAPRRPARCGGAAATTFRRWRRSTPTTTATGRPHERDLGLFWRPRRRVLPRRLRPGGRLAVRAQARPPGLPRRVRAPRRPLHRARVAEGQAAGASVGISAQRGR